MRELTLTLRWLAGERIRIRSRTIFFAAVAVSVLSLVSAFVLCRRMTRNLATGQANAILPADHDDVRFGVPLAKRKQVFKDLADAEPQARADGKKSFPGDELAWSAEDHRGAFERQRVAAAMGKYGLSQTQVYLILDEGIRQKWSGANGEPLTPFTVPLHPRRKYGW